MDTKGENMRNNVKKGIFILGSIGLMAGVAFGTCKTAENEKCTILTNTIRYAENISSSSEENTNTSSSTATTGTTSSDNALYKDENGNGIPDKIEELIQSNNVDSIMGTTITACMNACLNIITFIYGLYKWKSLKKGVNETASEATSNVNKWSSVANEIGTRLTSQQNNIEALQEKIEQATTSEDAQTKAIEELKAKNEELIKSNEALTKGYSSVSARLDTILANQQLVAENDKNSIANGVATKIAENTQEAINYGKQDKSETE